MGDSDSQLFRLYLFGAACTLFAVAYGFLDLAPGELMSVALALGPSLGVATWLAADARRTGVGAVYDATWLFYVGWPIAIPWYALRTRGRSGWWLAGKLYAIALSGMLGFIWGAFLRGVFDVLTGARAISPV